MSSNLAFQTIKPVAANAAVANIGQLLSDMGKLTPEDTERVLHLQKADGLRFGEAALKLGLVKGADVRQALALQFDYPYLQPGEGDFDPELVAAYEPFSMQVEGLRALRSQLMLRGFKEGPKTLALVSSGRGEGCSHLAANLAVVFSQLGERTLLVDANLREPRQHKIFKLTETRGLSEILAGRADDSVISRILPLMDLSVLGAGTIPPNPQELLGRNGFYEFMKRAAYHYDIVIVDTAPVSYTSDAQATAARCGNALLVSRLNHTKLSDLDYVREQISVTGAQILGAVVNDF